MISSPLDSLPLTDQPVPQVFLILWRRIGYLATIKHYQVHQGFKSKLLGLIDMTAITTIWGHSSAGRAPAWHEATKSIDMRGYN